MGVRITPAHAGTICNIFGSLLKPGDHPRARGDHLLFWPFYSPSLDHPRARGDHATMQADLLPDIGSPPRTRGPCKTYPGGFAASRITPAHAGTILFQIHKFHSR